MELTQFCKTNRPNLITIATHFTSGIFLIFGIINFHANFNFVAADLVIQRYRLRELRRKAAPNNRAIVLMNLEPKTRYQPHCEDLVHIRQYGSTKKFKV